jgi:hypothetical protein
MIDTLMTLAKPADLLGRTLMGETTDSNLRALIRLIPPARALREELEKGIHLELYAGTGPLAVGSFQGLQASVARLTEDPYVASLAIHVPESATDREKVSLALLAAGQLAAYLEGQTGLVGAGGQGSHEHQYQLAPNINIGNLTGITPAGAEKVVEIISDAVKGRRREESVALSDEG